MTVSLLYFSVVHLTLALLCFNCCPYELSLLLTNEYFLPAAVYVSMEMDEYSVNEGDGVVEVCAQLMVAPADGLQCSIVATLTPADAAKAGMSLSVCYSIGTILFGNSLFSSSRPRL